MADDKRMIQDYEVKTAIHIGSAETIFAENLASPEPYMVCNCEWGNPLGIEIYSKAVGSADYLEMMAEFTNRVSAAVEQIRDQRIERGVNCDMLTAADCIPGSKHAHYEHQLVVIRPENMVASARTADQQILLATGGNGCSPDALGQAVFCKNLFTGKSVRWERYDIAGIIAPDRVPASTHQRLEALQSGQEKVVTRKPSVAEQLKAGRSSAKPPVAKKRETTHDDKGR